MFVNGGGVKHCGVGWGYHLNFIYIFGGLQLGRSNVEK